MVRFNACIFESFCWCTGMYTGDIGAADGNWETGLGSCFGSSGNSKVKVMFQETAHTDFWYCVNNAWPKSLSSEWFRLQVCLRGWTTWCHCNSSVSWKSDPFRVEGQMNEIQIPSSSNQIPRISTSTSLRLQPCIYAAGNVRVHCGLAMYHITNRPFLATPGYREYRKIRLQVSSALVSRV